MGHPWLDQDPPVRDSPLETGPHRHASNLFSSRFAGRPTQATPCRPYRRGPLAEVPRNTRKYTQGRPFLKRPAKESKRQQKSLRARSSSCFKQKVYARALKPGPADTEKVNYGLQSDGLIVSCPCVTPSRISSSSVQPGRLSLPDFANIERPRFRTRLSVWLCAVRLPPP